MAQDVQTANKVSKFEDPLININRKPSDKGRVRNGPVFFMLTNYRYLQYLWKSKVGSIGCDIKL